MYILGINGGVRAGYQDVSTVLIKDGAVVYAIAEERLNRKKHAAGQLPFYGINEALKYAKISIQDIDYIATHGSTWGTEYESILKEYITYNFGFCPRIKRIHHHLAHAATAYYGSGFDKAIILTMDASGDGIAIQKAVGENGKIKVIEAIDRTNSLGIFYSIITQFCGFTRDSDEYKLMGLAPYGDPNKFDLSDILQKTNDTFILNNNYLKKLTPGTPQPSKQQAAYSNKLVQVFGKPRMPFEPILQKYMDIAASAQQRLNEAVINYVSLLYKETGFRNLCLAGGVALNCETNRLLMNLDFIDNIFVQPASGDDGISLGAAWYVSNEMGEKPIPTPNYYLGNEYSNDKIQYQLDLMGASYIKVNDAAAYAAKLVGKDKIVAWFQGRDEFGPRALGARSIFANPRNNNMKQILNQKIKFREGFRPFCPSILEANFKNYFKGKAKASPYMTINFDIVNTDLAPGVSHVNKTARIQTVNQEQNQIFYSFLTNLKTEIGIGMTINTSFNRNNEPIVHTPIEAVSAFYGSGIDALIIGDFALEKTDNPASNNLNLINKY